MDEKIGKGIEADMEEKKQTNKIVVKREQVRQVTYDACTASGMEEAFFEQLWQRFLKYDDIYKEYVVYLLKRDFPCEVKICGYSIVDILIWQMDHFKARMDMDTTKTKQDQTAMVLLAFDTFMKLREEPELYLHHLTEDTGTEYWGQFDMTHK